jgi:hypothetical protein
MTENTRSTDDVARNQRHGEPPASGTTDEAKPVDEASPDTPAVPQSGAFRSGAPSGEVSPT